MHPHQSGGSLLGPASEFKDSVSKAGCSTQHYVLLHGSYRGAFASLLQDRLKNNVVNPSCNAQANLVAAPTRQSSNAHCYGGCRMVASCRKTSSSKQLKSNTCSQAFPTRRIVKTSWWPKQACAL
eukprot:1181860-Amphidinium_carterae.1